jgi:hypothetical protein
MRILQILFVIFLLPQLCAAQPPDAGNVNPTPELDLQPAFPSPGEKVTVTFTDYRGGMVGSEINWFYNDNLIPDAKDKHEVSVMAPGVGEQASVKMVVNQHGLLETHRTTIKPIYLDLIVEPQTHVPEFYTGRALPSIGSQINVTALLSDGKSLSTNYIYTWRINDTVYENGPIRNQNIISFPMPQGSNSILSLQVSTYDGTNIAQRAIYLPSVKPEIHFYEINPLYGLSTKAIVGNFNLIGNSTTFRTEPYYLDSNVFNYPDILDWKINNQKATPDSNNPYEVTLERTGDPGSTRLDFHVRSLSQLLQGAKSGITINI